MAKKQKKKLTTKQKQKGYRTLQYTCVGGEFVSALLPFIVLGIANGEEWFVSEGGWKIGLGGSLALALVGIAVFLVTKKKEGESDITRGWITLIVGWFAVAFIFVLLTNILDQIAVIMLWGGLGLLGSFGLDITSRHFKTLADEYKDALKEVNGDTLKEKIKKEIEEEQAVE